MNTSRFPFRLVLSGAVSICSLLMPPAPLQAGQLTVKEPSTPDATLNLGDTLVIRATGVLGANVVREAAASSSSRKLRLFLQGVEIPGLASSIIVPENLEELVNTATALRKKANDAEAAVKTLEAALPTTPSDALEKAKTESVAAAEKAKAAEFEAGPDLSIAVERFAENDDSRRAWDTVFRSLKKSKYPVEVAIAIGDRLPVLVGRAHIASFPSTNPTAAIQFRASENVNWGIGWGCVTACVCLIFLFFNSKMLKDNGDKEAAFSLGRTQMAFWGIVVLSCFVGVLVAAKALEHIPAQVLVLLGISATTGLSAQLIQGDTPPQKGSKRRWGAAFFDDICVGDQGASFHRVQLLLWTVVLGGYFIWNVCQHMSMPVFGDTLLVLMGISNGTYLGFKPQEKRAEEGTDPTSASGALAATQAKLSDGALEAEISGGTAPYTWKIEGAALAGILEASGTQPAAGVIKIVAGRPTQKGTLTLQVTDAAGKTTSTALDVAP